MKKILLISLCFQGHVLIVAETMTMRGMHGHSHEGHLHETMVDGKRS